jgi:hypothetical protein
MFCVPVLVFGDGMGVGSRFHVLRSPTRFRRCGGRRVPFECFALLDKFSTVRSASNPMFCAPGLVFGGSEGVGSRFHVLHPYTSFSVVARVSGPVSMFCTPGLVFGSTDDVHSCFHVLRRRTRSRLFCRRRVPFSCFASPNSLSAVPRASRPVFKFCTSGHVFGDSEGVGSRFHALRSRTRFRRYRGHRILFSCFAHPHSFSTVSWASDPVIMFCAPGHVFGGADGVRSRFHVLRSRTHFRLYRGRRVSFLCFARPNSFSVVPTASTPFFMFCAHGHVFDGAEVTGSRFHVLLSRTHFRRYRGRRITFSCFAPSYRF